MSLNPNQMAYVAIVSTLIFGSIFVGVSGVLQTSEGLGNFDSAVEEEVSAGSWERAGGCARAGRRWTEPRRPLLLQLEALGRHSNENKAPPGPAASQSFISGSYIKIFV